MSLTIGELKEIIKDWPDDARISVYSTDDIHLSNCFVNKVVLEDYDNLGMIADFMF